MIIFSPNTQVQRSLVPDNFPNMRTEFCWAKCLGAEMWHLDDTHEVTGKADVNFFILPKNTREYDTFPLAFKRANPQSKVGIIQEGPIDMWEDWALTDIDNYFSILKSVDFICVHNQYDATYIEGLLNPKKVFVFPTLYDETVTPKPYSLENRQRVIVNGNCSSWYGARYAVEVLLDLGITDIVMTATGRRGEVEEEWCRQKGIAILPWIQWTSWMTVLNSFRLGINLMRTRAAGSFNMNCAVLGIPCIGFSDVDSQSLHRAYITSNKENYRQIRTTIKQMVQNDDIYKEFIPDPKLAKTMSITSNKPYFAHIVEEIKN